MARAYWGRRKVFGRAKHRQQTPWRRRLGLVLLLLLIFFGCLFGFVELQIRPVVELVAGQRAHLAVTKAINAAASEQLGGGVNYAELVTVHKDNAGNVVMLQADSVRISHLATGLAQKIESTLADMGSEGVLIPSGLLSGFTLLANIGPPIKVTIQPIGVVGVTVRDEFVSVGINQSKHQISLDVQVEASVMLPFTKQIIKVETTLPVAESVLVGPVPNTYLQMDGLFSDGLLKPK